MMKTLSSPSLRRCLIIAATIAAITAGKARENILLDNDWRFHLGDAPGANEVAYPDQDWQGVNLPHDWSISRATDPLAPSSGGGGFFPAGIGWYRKAVFVPDAWNGKRVSIEFEGVYQHAEVWINGQSLGMHPYGYTPFLHDLTDRLAFGSTNMIAVRVDNSQQPNCRWYSGSGIYRHVWLRVTDPIHIDDGGTVVSTAALSRESATLNIQTTVRNRTAEPAPVAIEAELLAPQGHSIAVIRSTCDISPGSSSTSSQTIAFPSPQPWSTETPMLYTLVTRAFADGRLTDETQTRFGVRTVSVSPDRGFELNGRPMNLMGGNVHHDNGALGAAAFDRAEERRVAILKTAGFNAIRTSHNPPSRAFLDACDRLGVLVVEEAFDGWAKKKTRCDYSTVFEDNWREDLHAMVRRDRNHPCVVMWSIGNEVYERGDATGAEIAAAMREEILSLDRSRPITAGINGLGKPEDWPRLDPLFAALDVAGYNYEETRHAADHQRLPSRVIALSESYQSDTFRCWEVVHDDPYVIGDFVWSAMDYLGEAGIGRVFPPGEKVIPHWEGNHYPWHGAACGDIDITGWRKPVSHYRNIVWNRGETLYAAVLTPSPTGDPWGLSLWSMPPALPSWTWPSHEGKPLRVEIYSRHQAIRLYINGELVGEQPTTRNEEFKAVFDVPYEPGTVRVAGVDEGKEVETLALRTTGEAKRIQLDPDRRQIRADGQDLSFVCVEVADRKRRRSWTAGPPIQYEIKGPGVIAGIGSGDLTTTESYQANPRHAYQGRAVVVIRSTGEPGRIVLHARAPGLQSGRTVVRAK